MGNNLSRETRKNVYRNRSQPRSGDRMPPQLGLSLPKGAKERRGSKVHAQTVMLGNCIWGQRPITYFVNCL
jgi:hypothetical protein